MELKAWLAVVLGVLLIAAGLALLAAQLLSESSAPSFTPLEKGAEAKEAPAAHMTNGLGFFSGATGAQKTSAAEAPPEMEMDEKNETTPVGAMPVPVASMDFAQRP